MPSEIREKPPPTPHPDQPRTTVPASDGARRRGPAPEPAPEFDPDEIAYDSVVDDLNLKLAQAFSEPDPALRSIDPSALGLPTDKRDQPGTAEIFEDVAPGLDHVRARRPGWGSRLLARVRGAGGRRSSGSRGAGEAIPAPHRTGEFHRVDAGSHDDENGADPRSTLLTLVLLSYSSAVTLGLAWVLWSGRSLGRPDDQAAPESQRADEPKNAKSPDLAAIRTLPPIPAKNIASPGQTIRLGDLEITPLSVTHAPIGLSGSIDPGEYRQEEVPSLVLRIKLTNASSADPLRPLARSLVRDAASPHDRSFVETSDGGKIDLYPLAVESEWVIIGQEFPILKPGETVETLIATEPVSADRLRDKMTWHIRLRIGSYQTDMLGVPFSKSDLSQ